LKICYFGTYDEQRPRNRIIIRGLKENGVEIVECHFPLWKNIEDKSRINRTSKKLALFIRFIGSRFILPAKYFFLPPHQAVIVGYLGHFDIFLARFLCVLKNKPLYFNAFLSLYDTLVNDRKLIRPNTFLAKVIFYLDKISCQLADHIFLDTESQIDYFTKIFKLRKSKFSRVFVGAETGIFYPRTKTAAIQENKLKVLFYGQFIPLQGIEFIIEAAKLLKDEDIKFTIIGRGQEYERILSLAKAYKLNNICWIDWVNYQDLPKYIAEADICLGIFGRTGKARRVIPNKAFQAIAMGKALITGDSPAAKELFKNEENAFLCKMADPSVLAESIIKLKKDSNLRDKIAGAGYRLFKSKCPPRVITQGFLNHLLKKTS